MAKTNAIILSGEVHLMFGKYSGYVVADNGESIREVVTLGLNLCVSRYYYSILFDFLRLQVAHNILILCSVALDPPFENGRS